MKKSISNLVVTMVVLFTVLSCNLLQQGLPGDLEIISVSLFSNNTTASSPDDYIIVQFNTDITEEMRTALEDLLNFTTISGNPVNFSLSINPVNSKVVWIKPTSKLSYSTSYSFSIEDIVLDQNATLPLTFTTREAILEISESAAKSYGYAITLICDRAATVEVSLDSGVSFETVGTITGKAYSQTIEYAWSDHPSKAIPLSTIWRVSDGVLSDQMTLEPVLAADIDLTDASTLPYTWEDCSNEVFLDQRLNAVSEAWVRMNLYSLSADTYWARTVVHPTTPYLLGSYLTTYNSNGAVALAEVTLQAIEDDDSADGNFSQINLSVQTNGYYYVRIRTDFIDTDFDLTDYGYVYFQATFVIG